MLSVSSKYYGQLKGSDLYLITLKNEQMSVTITNLGCSITAIYTPDRNGVMKNVVAGFSDLQQYERNEAYFGCVVGRYANRIAYGRFLLDGQPVQLSVNDAGNHLHGGFEGFHKKVWEIVEVTDTGVVMEYLSRDREEGYPGNLRVKVQYTLDNEGRFSIQYTGMTDQCTPVNLTNHSYFNLSGFEQPLITDHLLYINAYYYTGKNELNVPDGKILKVEGTPLSFLQPKRIGADIDRFPADQGFDHNYVLNGKREDGIVPAATLYDPLTGRQLRVFTDQPGLQLYTANLWDGSLYEKHGAVALETQAFPDSPNHPQFPGTILEPGSTYETCTIYEFSVLKSGV
ncbi:aldose 1-epimerase [Chitinophaga sp. CF118]|uniref:aldose epimerase family protein n=1 Tax=Chitinophaga sp. CF118 TaxID=1884367 RepID=UPI0008E2D022|nr:aldose epimerase family protein [Chitinophaga sp. CF118]SFE43555.1 aldose 1-epimerase [Chitinophaga sp. CF118]